MKKLGIDCEGVIFHAYGKSIANSLDSLRKIKESGHFEEMYIVSKAGIFGRIYFPLRLRYLNFSNRTGIPWSNIYFCWHQEDKAIITKRLGITDFVDDQCKVLRHMSDENCYAFDPKGTDLELYSKAIKHLIVVRSWDELLPALISS